MSPAIVGIGPLQHFEREADSGQGSAQFMGYSVTQIPVRLQQMLNALCHAVKGLAQRGQPGAIGDGCPCGEVLLAQCSGGLL